MSQFCAYKNPNSATRIQYPFLLDIQNDLLRELRTTIVIPLSPSKIAAPISLTRLNPILVLDGERFTPMTQDMAGIDHHQIGAQEYDLSVYRLGIVAAVDLVLSGI